MTSESIKIGTSGTFLLNSRFSSSSSLWDIWISERFCIKNALFWGDDTNPSIFLVLPHRVSVFSSFLGSGGGGGRLSFFASFLISTTCQVGQFDSHTFWSLIEFFIENLVLTGGRYINITFKHGDIQFCMQPKKLHLETAKSETVIKWREGKHRKERVPLSM